MKVGLFIPCYIDQLCAKVASAMLKLLKKLSLEVHFPTEQTFCCCHGARNLTIFILAEPA
ncbi:heterodisulfide reductase-related iron-sulfur binding cluster [Pedobacter psychrodurus]|uniref:heterodisulfide reductase-related iron-sulfur binding cluster n=1 Tax=Pedobacter psychrodurus TaxID=2530456 RepID=UPI00292E5081|nr:heterodisulfide reductase-related iron-sulfur binding cluster [Pedobacter psychrodurus]